jgi:hypothetical protein
MRRPFTVARSRAVTPRLPLPAALAAAALLAGCAPTLAPADFAERRPELRPERFFAGETRSQGVLEAASGAPSQRFTVAGHGEALPDGGFRLDQRVAFEGRPPRMRSWRLRATGPHQYEGVLTDAAGPVRAEAYGDLFHLRYRLKGVPFGAMEQWLYLQADGATVVNEAVVRIAGVPVRRLSERISRTGPPPSPPPTTLPPTPPPTP